MHLKLNSPSPNIEKNDQYLNDFYYWNSNVFSTLLEMTHPY